MNYDYNHDDIRGQIRRRYNRRFFLGAHLISLVVMFVMALFVPRIGVFTVLLALAFIPHAIFVIYGEYQYWLDHRIERELDDSMMMSEKPKRHLPNQPQSEAFRLTDDGEIEPVHSRQIEKEKPALRQQHSRRYERDDDDDERKQAYKSRRRKRDKKHRKDDTDEFDVRKLLKKLKDIID